MTDNTPTARTEWGVEFPGGIMSVTDDQGLAEETVQWIVDGYLVSRQVIEYPWCAVGEPAPRVEMRPLGRCRAGSDGECNSGACPQLQDDEPMKSGRSCPIYDWSSDE